MWPWRDPDRERHHSASRLTMVRDQLERRGIGDKHLLQAMRDVPRHAFAPEDRRMQAYGDHPVPIAEAQTISQPYMVALMIEHLRLRGGERVLEIGTGSGYQAAVLSRIAAKVYTVEYFPSLAAHARLIMQQLGYENIRVVRGNGCQGLSEQAPYRGIIVSAAAPFIPASLRTQLAEGGRLVMPVGGPDEQRLIVLTRQAGAFIEERTIGCRFVPLLGVRREDEPGASPNGVPYRNVRL